MSVSTHKSVKVQSISMVPPIAICLIHFQEVVNASFEIQPQSFSDIPQILYRIICL